MATRISVTVKGPLGLDDPDQLLAELTRATGVTWTPRVVDQGTVLIGGIAEVVLFAVVGKGTEIMVGAVVERAQESVARWRRSRLDEVQTEVRTETAPDAELPDGDEGAGH